MSSNPYRFTGREWEPMGTGMYFMRERYMMPLWTRFLSRDPMGFAAGSTNLYTYAGNSPTNFTDRLGLEVLGTIDIGVVSGGDGGGGPVKRSGAGGPCDGPCPSVGFVFPQVQGTLDKLRRQRGTKSGPQLFFERPTPPELRQRRDKQPQEGMTMEQYQNFRAHLGPLTRGGYIVGIFVGAGIGGYLGGGLPGAVIGGLIGGSVGALAAGIVALNAAQRGTLGHAP